MERSVGNRDYMFPVPDKHVNESPAIGISSKRATGAGSRDPQVTSGSWSSSGGRECSSAPTSTPAATCAPWENRSSRRFLWSVKPARRWPRCSCSGGRASASAWSRSNPARKSDSGAARPPMPPRRQLWTDRRGSSALAPQQGLSCQSSHRLSIYNAGKGKGRFGAVSWVPRCPICGSLPQRSPVHISPRLEPVRSKRASTAGVARATIASSGSIPCARRARRSCSGPWWATAPGSLPSSASSSSGRRVIRSFSRRASGPWWRPGPSRASAAPSG